MKSADDASHANDGRADLPDLVSGLQQSIPGNDSIHSSLAPVAFNSDHDKRNEQTQHEGPEGQTARSGEQRAATSPWTQYPPAQRGANAGSYDVVEKRARQVMAQQAKLEPLKRDVQVVRDRANYEWEARYHQRRFVQDSQKAFMEEADALLSRLPPDPAFSKLQTLYQDVRNDQQALVEQAAISRTIEADLSDLQYRMIKKEGSLTKAVRRLLDSMQSLELATVSAQSDAEHRPHSSRSQTETLPEINPLLAEYYDKVGDVRIMQERIADLSADHGDEQVRRAFQADMGEHSKMSEQDFGATYSSMLWEAERALSDAVQAAEVARATCLQSGLEVDAGLETMAEATGDGDVKSTASDIPGTPSTLALGMDVMTPSALQLRNRTEMDAFSAMISHDTGLPDSNFSPALTRERDKDYTKARTVDWVQDVPPTRTSQGLAKDHYQPAMTIFENSRPTSIRSLPTLKVNNGLLPMERPMELRSQSEQPRAGRLFTARTRLRSGSHSLILPARRSSDSSLSNMRSRHDSHEDVLEDLKTNPP
ncbi:hypothetical protein LTR85_002330 [Meristemomyces frigidus]|nr:hypothetical protein LTR85_002330 [Meristemomyces frigidus]